MRHVLRTARPLAAGVVLSLALVACGGNDGATQTDPTSEPPSSAPADPSPTAAPSEPASEEPTADAAGNETGAAALRATLTYKLEEHLYLAGIAIVTKLQNPDAPELFEAAAAALDRNSVDLATAVDGVYAGAKDPFLELWRNHISFFVEYTEAKAGGDDTEAEAALARLDGYRADFGALLESVNPNLPQAAVADELVPHVDTVIATIDAAIAGDGTAFDKLREAGSHMPHTANVLAGAIVAQFPEQFDGSVDSSASELRSGLTALLTEHVYLAGIAITQTLGETGGGEAATATLDANSVALADAVDGVYEGARDPFLELWRNHIGFFVEYAGAKAGGDEMGAEEALTKLDGYRADFGALLESVNPNLPQEAVADELVPHVDTVLAAIDSAIAGDGMAFDKLYEAATHMPHTANVLAGAIVAQFPADFAG